MMISTFGRTFAGFVTVMGSSAGARAQGNWGHGWMWDSNWGWGGMMGLGMVLFWGLVILLIVLAVRAFSGLGSGRDSIPPADKTPLQILQERYARGEIDKEEYEERRRTLSGT